MKINGKRIGGSVIAHAIIAAGVIGGLAYAHHDGHEHGHGHDGHAHKAPADGITGERLLGMGDVSNMDPARMAEMMQSYAKLNQKSDGHTVLKRFAGEWSVTQQMMMPGMPDMSASGTAKTELMLGGKYLKTSYSSSFMGQPFNGMGVLGYDNLRKQFFQFWIDDMGTAPHLSYGGLSQDGMTITLVGQMDEPTTGEIGKASMFKTTWVDDDHYYMEAQEIIYGEPFTVMRLDYERKN